MRKINIENLFTVFALLFGLTFSILFPLYQTPDELSHIDMIYEERNLDIHFLDINDNFTGSDNLIQETSNKVKLKDYFDFNKRIKIKSNFVVPKITIIRHFPQFIGMLIGEYFLYL